MKKSIPFLQLENTVLLKKVSSYIKIPKPIIQLENSEILKKADSYIKKLQASDGLMNLIINPKYEFNLNLSSRMLNYHDKNGFIKFHRDGDAGKRRFSLSNAVGFEFSMYLKSIGFKNSEITQYNEVLHEKDENGFSDLDKIVYFGSILFGLTELWVIQLPLLKTPLNYRNIIHLTTAHRNNSLNLNSLLRQMFFDDLGNLKLSKKSQPFLRNYISEIDKCRGVLKLEPLLDIQNGFVDSDYSSQNPETLLYSKQFSLSYYNKIYDLLYRDDKNNLFGIKIEHLKTMHNPIYDSKVKLITKLEQLKQAIEEEIEFNQRMLDKLSKDK